jgi:uncharacterized protein YukE
MGGEFRIDVDGFARPAPTFAAASKDIDAAITHLQSVIQAEGPCWGGDGPGKAFADGKNHDGYESDLQEGLQHLNALPGVLERVGHNITTVAERTWQQDQDRAAGVRQVAQGF